ncbi:MAG: hydrogenase expression/formation protein HypE [Omnitrophica WOR_2 bacterium GWA2_45_18]|nr:MAG: hydrogenase expression/formation protein HypE [Omnitrophica WOR_2 bacterium GWA2_45_18]
MTVQNNFSLSCSIPIQEYPHILLAHGSGGKLMHQLIEKMFVAAFGQPQELGGHDAAVVSCPQSRIAFTTDSYVVRPLFFPGGDIGKLAVNGTVNDLAMAGARPLYLSAGFILEEGLAMDVLWRVVCSMQQAAREAGVRIITGDTKVVDRGKGDGVFINTAGIGGIEHKCIIHPSRVQKGDSVIVNGDIARHGMAIMAVREGLEFESAIESDTAPLADIVGHLIAQEIEVHCLRDLTRGGLATSLNEIALAADKEILVEESSVSVREDVASACEMLGIDPLYVANEGRFVVFVSPRDEKRVLDILRGHPNGAGAAVIGRVTEGTSGTVMMKSRMGTTRILDMLTSEPLPRIC